MKFLRGNHRKPLAAAIAMAAINLPISADACSPPPPPVEYDARLSLAVTPDQHGDLVPGTTGRIDLTLDMLFNPSGAAIEFFINTPDFRNPPQLLPPGALRPIRLTAAPENTCSYHEVLATVPLGSTYLYSLLGNVSVQTPQFHCSLRFEVLPAAAQLRSLTFSISPRIFNSCNPYRDLNLDNNTAEFVYGGVPVQAVPLGSRMGWMALALAIVATAIANMATGRRTLRRRQY